MINIIELFIIIFISLVWAFSAVVATVCICEIFNLRLNDYNAIIIYIIFFVIGFIRGYTGKDIFDIVIKLIHK